MDVIIRNETVNDYREVENVTREAFWNLFVPGCEEHYLAHIIRKHQDFIPELTFVAAIKNRIIGSIMYAKSQVIDVHDATHIIDTISFGPVSVLPEYQKQGIGSILIKHSINAAKNLAYKAVFIEGHPYNYCKHGFKSSIDFKISDLDGKYPYSFLVLELEKKVFEGYSWRYCPSSVYEYSPEDAVMFDQQFVPKKKEVRYTQEEFSIASRAYILM